MYLYEASYPAYLISSHPQKNPEGAIPSSHGLLCAGGQSVEANARPPKEKQIATDDDDAHAVIGNTQKLRIVTY